VAVLIRGRYRQRFGNISLNTCRELRPTSKPTPSTHQMYSFRDKIPHPTRHPECSQTPLDMLLLFLCTLSSHGTVLSTRPNVFISSEFPAGSSRHILILPAVYAFLTLLIVLKVLKAGEAEIISAYLLSALTLFLTVLSFSTSGRGTHTD
jgi:hypothetical protein